MRAIIFLPILIMFSCQNIRNETSKDANASICTDSIKYLNLINATINLPALQQYYRVQETIKQNELVVLDENLLYKGIEHMFKFNKPIYVLKKTEIEQKNIKAYLEYREVNINGDSASVYYRYNIQGIGVKAKYVLQDTCNWHLLDFHLWEN